MGESHLTGALCDLGLEQRLRPTASDSLEHLQRKRQAIALLLQGLIHASKKPTAVPGPHHAQHGTSGSHARTPHALSVLAAPAAGGAGCAALGPPPDPQVHRQSEAPAAAHEAPHVESKAVGTGAACERTHKSATAAPFLPDGLMTQGGSETSNKASTILPTAVLGLGAGQLGRQQGSGAAMAQGSGAGKESAKSLPPQQQKAAVDAQPCTSQPYHSQQQAYRQRGVIPYPPISPRPHKPGSQVSEHEGHRWQPPDRLQHAGQTTAAASADPPQLPAGTSIIAIPCSYPFLPERSPMAPSHASGLSPAAADFVQATPQSTGLDALQQLSMVHPQESSPLLLDIDRVPATPSQVLATQGERRASTSHAYQQAAQVAVSLELAVAGGAMAAPSSSQQGCQQALAREAAAHAHARYDAHVGMDAEDAVAGRPLLQHDPSVLNPSVQVHHPPCAAPDPAQHPEHEPCVLADVASQGGAHLPTAVPGVAPKATGSYGRLHATTPGVRTKDLSHQPDSSDGVQVHELQLPGPVAAVCVSVCGTLVACCMQQPGVSYEPQAAVQLLQLCLLQASSEPVRLTRISSQSLQLQATTSNPDAPLSNALAVMRPCVGGNMTPMIGRTAPRAPISTGVQDDSSAAGTAGTGALPPMLLLSSVLHTPGMGQPGDQHHVRMVVSQAGGWRLHGVLEAQQPMHCVLVPSADGCTVVAAGVDGAAHMWRLEAPHMAIADSYRLPQAHARGAPLGTITALSAVGTRPHLVLGSTLQGGVALWDTWRRQLLLGVLLPGLTGLAALRPVELLLQLKAHRARSTGPTPGRAAQGGECGISAGAAVGSSEGQGLPGPALQQVGTAIHVAHRSGLITGAPAGPGHTPLMPVAGSRRGGALPAHAHLMGAAATTPLHAQTGAALTQGTLLTGGWSTGGWPTGATHVTGAATGPWQGAPAWAPELLSPPNPLVLLALVRHAPDGSHRSADGGSSHALSIPGQADGCVRPVLITSSSADVLPPLSLSHGVMCCDARGSSVVLVSAAGDVVMWDVVRGGPVWALHSMQARTVAEQPTGMLQQRWGACTAFCTDHVACVGHGTSLLLCCST